MGMHDQSTLQFYEGLIKSIDSMDFESTSLVESVNSSIFIDELTLELTPSVESVNFSILAQTQ